MPTKGPEGDGLIHDLSMRAPHVVVLGAGASLAACQDGDATGKKVPLMKHLAAIVGLGELLGGIDVTDFETVYSELAADPANAQRCAEIESRIRDYFASLLLPDAPTVYDYLVLSLRPKDVIATFNWDPFLLQAIQRSYRNGHRPPTPVFLHGNVAVGFCVKDQEEGPISNPCSACGQPYSPSRLLYPVGKKDYDSDPQIREAWRYVRRAFEHAFMVTIFGYSAPVSDATATGLLRAAWGSPDDRSLEQFEIIDIRDEADLHSTWQGFIHSHHYEVHESFFDSYMALHPRRTGEAWRKQYMEAQWLHANRAPRDVTMDELREWFWPLEDAES